ncbi:hypothetical protein [Nitrosomonas sp. JL21]|nr:hypothetical protein [Nitrosomonas sp. JL21]
MFKRILSQSKSIVNVAYGRTRQILTVFLQQKFNRYPNQCDG